VTEDAEIAQSLRALGYFEGGAEEACDGIDPKDGLALREAVDAAQFELERGQAAIAVKRLEEVLKKNPSNPVAWTRLSAARAGAGDLEGAAAAQRRAAGLRPSSEFSQLALGDAELRIENRTAARAAWREAVAIDPRYAAVWVRLAVLARQDGGTEAERSILRQARAAGTASATLLMRQAALEENDEADRLFAAATELVPKDSAPWLEWGRSMEERRAIEEAESRYREAIRRAPDDPRPELALGRLLLNAGKLALARHHLQRAADLGRDTPAGNDAVILLYDLAKGVGPEGDPESERNQ
jgi:tetratricopeptide (TPR) repeat protein